MATTLAKYSTLRAELLKSPDSLMKRLVPHMVLGNMGPEDSVVVEINGAGHAIKASVEEWEKAIELAIDSTEEAIARKQEIAVKERKAKKNLKKRLRRQRKLNENATSEANPAATPVTSDVSSPTPKLEEESKDKKPEDSKEELPPKLKLKISTHKTSEFETLILNSGIATKERTPVIVRTILKTRGDRILEFVLGAFDKKSHEEAMNAEFIKRMEKMMVANAWAKKHGIEAEQAATDDQSKPTADVEQAVTDDQSKPTADVEQAVIDDHSKPTADVEQAATEDQSKPTADVEQAATDDQSKPTADVEQVKSLPIEVAL